MTTEQLVKANAALVRYPRFNELHQDIRLCQEMSKIAGEPQCMILEGIAGAGKSTLVKNYSAAFSRWNKNTCLLYGNAIPSHCEGDGCPNVGNTR